MGARHQHITRTRFDLTGRLVLLGTIVLTSAAIDCTAAAAQTRTRELVAVDSWMSGIITSSRGTKFYSAILMVPGEPSGKRFVSIMCPERPGKRPHFAFSPALFAVRPTPPKALSLFNDYAVVATASDDGVIVPLDLSPSLTGSSTAQGSTDKLMLTRDKLHAGHGAFTFRLDSESEEILIRPRMPLSEPAARTAMADLYRANFKPTDLATALTACQGFAKSPR